MEYRLLDKKNQKQRRKKMRQKLQEDLTREIRRLLFEACFSGESLPQREARHQSGDRPCGRPQFA